ncbi:intracellular calcium channel modulator CCP-Ts-like [Centruroides vittatus]|uniref:intracellular calcium channel modulator CCP-Ts-like n=1 Tax=Centruroides vittatus TaxID=120091 RepID=UPI00350FC663
MNLRFIIILGVLLASGVCTFARIVDEQARCSKLGKPCDSDSDCCRYGERCLSSGRKYVCKMDPGP